MKLNLDDLDNDLFIYLAEEGHSPQFRRIFTSPRHSNSISNKAKSLAYMKIINHEHDPQMVIAILSDGKVDPNVVVANSPYQLTSLMWAERNGHVELIKYLLSDPRTNWDAIDYRGRNVAELILRKNKVHCLKALLDDQTFDINARYGSQRQLIHFACIYNHIECLKVLLADERIDVCSQDANDQQPIHLSKSAEITSLLLTNPKINPTARDVTGKQPIHFIQNKEMLAVLLSDPR